MNPPLLAAMVPGEDAVPSPQLIIAVKSLAAPFRFPSLKFATTPLKAAPCMAVKITLVAVSPASATLAFGLRLALFPSVLLIVKPARNVPTWT